MIAVDISYALAFTEYWCCFCYLHIVIFSFLRLGQKSAKLPTNHCKYFCCLEKCFVFLNISLFFFTFIFTNFL